ncbi:MAG TPA: hypothetical protein VIH28_10180 [Ignavibacteriaceae bacterium]
MTDKEIIKLLKKHGIQVELGATYSVRCQIAQIINVIKEITAPSVQEQPGISPKTADLIKDLIKLLDGEYAPPFAKIPEKYKKDFKSWTGEIKQQEWTNWERAWQIYNREYIVYVLQNLLLFQEKK